MGFSIPTQGIGGLEIQNPNLQNKSLLNKWLYKLCTVDEMWQKLLRNAYLNNKALSQVKRKARGSHFLMDLMAVKDQFSDLVRLLNGQFSNQVLARHLVSEPTLSYKFVNLFNIVRKKHATVDEVFNTVHLNISFRRALIGNKLLEWNNLIITITNVNLQAGNDTIILDLK